jgi:hypothetical protein
MRGYEVNEKCFNFGSSFYEKRNNVYLSSSSDFFSRNTIIENYAHRIIYSS